MQYLSQRGWMCHNVAMSILRLLGGFFFKGLLIVIPSVVFIYFIFGTIGFVHNLLPELPNLLAFLISVLLIIAVGALFGSVLARKMERIVRRGVKKIPPFDIVYESLRALFSSLIAKKTAFEHPVLVVNPEKNERRIAFITRDMQEFGLAGYAAVYIPDAFAASGEMRIISKDLIVPFEMDIPNAYTFAVTGGLVTGLDANILKEKK